MGAGGTIFGAGWWRSRGASAGRPAIHHMLSTYLVPAAAAYVLLARPAALASAALPAVRLAIVFGSYETVLRWTETARPWAPGTALFHVAALLSHALPWGLALGRRVPPAGWRPRLATLLGLLALAELYARTGSYPYRTPPLLAAVLCGALLLV